MRKMSGGRHPGELNCQQRGGGQRVPRSQTNSFQHVFKKEVETNLL
jgi:hypothetical protein